MASFWYFPAFSDFSSELSHCVAPYCSTLSKLPRVSTRHPQCICYCSPLWFLLWQKPLWLFCVCNTFRAWLSAQCLPYEKDKGYLLDMNCLLAFIMFDSIRIIKGIKANACNKKWAAFPGSPMMALFYEDGRTHGPSHIDKEPPAFEWQVILEILFNSIGKHIYSSENGISQIRSSGGSGDFGICSRNPEIPHS